MLSIFLQKSKWRLFEALKKIMWDLVKYRQQLLSGTLPKVTLSIFFIVHCVH